MSERLLKFPGILDGLAKRADVAFVLRAAYPHHLDFESRSGGGGTPATGVLSVQDAADIRNPQPSSLFALR
ncbi:hypothetical protein MRX96_029268 [Rhipicephalus microplus]